MIQKIGRGENTSPVFFYCAMELRTLHLDVVIENYLNEKMLKNRIYASVDSSTLGICYHIWFKRYVMEHNLPILQRQPLVNDVFGEN